MSFATTRDNVRLHYEEAGSGTPIVFVHEFAGDWRAWEPQMRYFARRYRCVTFSFRGYHPSDVPPEKSSYGYERFRDDVIAVMDHLKIDKAHICGLSMGGYATLNVGMTYPQRALSLTMAGTGSGSERGVLEEFRKASEATATEYDKVGAEGVAKTYGMGPARIPFEVKDPRGYKEFYDQFASHAPRAPPTRCAAIRRPAAVYEFEAEIKKIALPTLIVCGDEDDACIEPSVYLKKHIATSGPRDLPEERPHGEHRGARAVQPDARRFSRTWTRAWGKRDPARSAGEDVTTVAHRAVAFVQHHLDSIVEQPPAFSRALCARVLAKSAPKTERARGTPGPQRTAGLIASRRSGGAMLFDEAPLGLS
jgi:pimeloyl-ACP methyl ester carboxylesterase